MSTNFYNVIRGTLLQHPEQVFIVWPSAESGSAVSTSYTGRAILTRVQAIREELQQTGQVVAGQPMLLAMPVSIDLICGLLAVMALGATPVLPPAGASSTAIIQLIHRARIKVVVMQQHPRLTVRLLAWALRVRVTTISELPGPVAEPEAGVAVADGQLALLSQSSGSTGRPKGIRRSHQVLLAQHEAIKAVFPPYAGQRDFPLFPNILLHNLAAGVTSILPDIPWCATPQMDAGRVLAQMAQERVQTLTGNVFYFTSLLQYLQKYPVELPEVTALGIGGSPVPEPLVQGLRAYFPRAAIHVIYGSSEAEPIAVREVGQASTNPLAGYCVGTVHPALELQVVPLGQLVRGANSRGPIVGEIQVRGPHVASTAPGQWLSTGDYGYVADGQLYLTGRQGNERLHQGVQHYQLEHLLYHLPGVQRVAARSDATGFTLFLEGTVQRPEVEELLAKNFPAAICSAIHFRASLPVDSRHHSKILYAQLS